jgi:hypothetical protein
MANDALAADIKRILGLARAGKVDEAYEGYRALFSSDVFRTYRPEDQRQALRIMLRATDALTSPTQSALGAHRAALAPLTELVSTHGEPADHEMLGMCHLLLGNAASASAIYRAGLAIERERSPQSDLCGTLMKRVSLI